MSDIVVRPVDHGDYEAWLPLWTGYNTFYERVSPDEVTAVTWRRFFDAYEPMHCLVAEQDRRLVGIVHYIFHRNTWFIDPVCYLQDLFTAEDVRGNGIGRKLIEAVYAKAREAGSPRVYWTTQEKNARARLLYDKIATQSDFIQYRKPLA